MVSFGDRYLKICTMHQSALVVLKYHCQRAFANGQDKEPMTKAASFCKVCLNGYHRISACKRHKIDDAELRGRDVVWILVLIIFQIYLPRKRQCGPSTLQDGNFLDPAKSVVLLRELFGCQLLHGVEISSVVQFLRPSFRRDLIVLFCASFQFLSCWLHRFGTFPTPCKNSFPLLWQAPNIQHQVLSI